MHDFTKLFLVLVGLFSISNFCLGQIQTGVWRTPIGNTDYHHFVRNGVGPAVYINQESTMASHPILRLSSGSAAANQNVKFTVENNGNVGIGTMAPTGRLNIDGSTTIGGKWNPAASFLTITHGSNMLIMDHNEMYSNAMIAIGSTSGDVVDFRRVTSTGFQSFMMLKQDGKLGIGTSNPTGKVEIKHIGTIGGKWDPSNSYLTISDGTNSMIMDSNEIYASGTIALGAKSGSIIFRTLIGETSAADRMVITNLGNIGIGTGTPNEKLEVNGNIKTKEVNVTTSDWADYVFDADYSLMDLATLKSYLQKEKHLPNIPTAQEVAECGVNLGEMNVKLLEKIEELTLYIIQQDEKIDQQNEQHKRQSEEISQLRSEIQTIKELLLEK